VESRLDPMQGAFASMKAAVLPCLLSLALGSGCVNLDKPKALVECSANGLCSDQPALQTGGATGGGTTAGGGVVGTAGGTVAGGIGAGGIDGGVGGITGSGGLVGFGGATALDAPLGAGGIVGSGGRLSLDGAAGAGGILGSGGSAAGGALDGSPSGGVIAAGGATGLDGALSLDAAGGAGGVLESGGSTSSGGAVATGGATGSGGKTGSGGVVTTGGTVGTGGSTVAGCATTKSTFSQTFDFSADLQALTLGPNSTSGSVKRAIVGPATKPTLCTATAGCAALSVPFSSAAAYAAFALAVENFTPTINLVGSTVTFSLAIDNPAQVPIQLQAYTQGDVTATYAWTNPATVGGASLLPYAASIGFKDLALSVTNFVSTTGKYCAAVTAAIGIQVMNTAAITSANAGTVTVYISKITVTPPP
jgi:hypothetical protein